MIKYYLFILLFFSISVIFGQLPQKPWSPIEFKSKEPLWQNTLYDEYAKSDSTDGYNKLEFWFDDVIIFDNSIVTYSYIKSKDIEGGFIQRTDLSSGETIWKNRFDYILDGKQKGPKSMFLNKYNNVEIIGNVSLDSFSTNRFLPFGVRDDRTVFFRKIYDVNSGKLIYNYEANEDTGLMMSYSIGGGSRHTRMYKNEFEENIKIIRNPLINGSQALQMVEIDTFGVPLSYSDTLKITGLVRAILKDDSTLIALTSDSQRVVLQYFDEKFKTKKIIKLPKEISSDNYGIKSYDPIEKTFFIVSQIFNINSIDSFVEFKIYKISTEGQLLGEWSFFSYKNHILNILNYGDDVYVFNYENSVEKSDSVSTISIRKANEVGTFDKIYNLELTDEDKIVFVMHSFVNNAKNLILLLDESSLYKYASNSYAVDKYANALTVMAFNDVEFPFILSTKKELSQNYFKVQPNPSDVFNFYSDVCIEKIEIYNSYGQTIKNISFNSESGVFDLSDVSNGVYFIKAFTCLKRVVNYKIIKI
ncbi:MAG: T9SS type A sorting domain-containing protein [Saprospiraceae bacterium]|nr:T9SS type A sorting domain-containing protein [Saprospiraceae bacterium]